MPYLFTSSRLGFRNWNESDIAPFAAMCANPAVMEFFPEPLSFERSKQTVERFQTLFEENGFTYFAVDELSSGDFIGFIGMFPQTYESPYTPCVDIGWRLRQASWGNGYATEGAKRCLEFAFQDLDLETIRAFAPKVNQRSIHVMEKIGMKKIGHFLHPKLKGNARIEECVCYEIATPKS